MKSLMVVFVFIIVLSFASSLSLGYSDIHHHRLPLNNATDQHSLLEFKAAITHDAYQSLASWNSNISFCGWTGVTCSARRQRVVALNLSEYGFGAMTSTNGDVYSFGIVLLEMLTRKRPTNGIFVDGLNLPKWVSMAFPNRILEVVDGSLLLHCNNGGIDEAKTINCLVQFLHLGLSCTNESSDERPNMRGIVQALQRIKGTFFGTQMAYGLQPNISYLLTSQVMESQSSSSF